MKVPFLIGRAVFGGFFLYNGIHHFRNLREIAEYAKGKHVPLAEAGVAVSGMALIFGGASILLGIKPKYGVAALAGFLAVVSPVIHDFWNAPAERQMTESINFLKNMALLGAALALLGQEEPWPISVPVREPGPIEKVVRLTKRLAA